VTAALSPHGREMPGTGTCRVMNARKSDERQEKKSSQSVSQFIVSGSEKHDCGPAGMALSVMLQVVVLFCAARAASISVSCPMFSSAGIDYADPNISVVAVHENATDAK
jgi:hypothetical protein